MLRTNMGMSRLKSTHVCTREYRCVAMSALTELPFTKSSRPTSTLEPTRLPYLVRDPVPTSRSRVVLARSLVVGGSRALDRAGSRIDIVLTKHTLEGCWNGASPLKTRVISWTA